MPGCQEMQHRQEGQRVLGTAQAPDLACWDPITPARLVVGWGWGRGEGGRGAIRASENQHDPSTLARGDLAESARLRPSPSVPEKASKFHTAEPWGGHGMSRQGHIQTVKTFSSVEEREPLAVLLASTDVVYI